MTFLLIGLNRISDLSPLVPLTRLTCLGLGGNEISDITPLSGLTNLVRLDLSVNHISDLSPLAGLTSLMELDLGNNRISDLSPLAGLTNLTKLDLYWNRAPDLSPLASLTNLRELYLDDADVCDLSPLAALTDLKVRRIRYNRPYRRSGMIRGVLDLHERGRKKYGIKHSTLAVDKLPSSTAQSAESNRMGVIMIPRTWKGPRAADSNRNGTSPGSADMNGRRATSTPNWGPP